MCNIVDFNNSIRSPFVNPPSSSLMSALTLSADVRRGQIRRTRFKWCVACSARCAFKSSRVDPGCECLVRSTNGRSQSRKQTTYDASVACNAFLQQFIGHISTTAKLMWTISWDCTEVCSTIKTYSSDLTVEMNSFDIAYTVLIIKYWYVHIRYSYLFKKKQKK